MLSDSGFLFAPRGLSGSDCGRTDTWKSGLGEHLETLDMRNRCRAGITLEKCPTPDLAR